MDNHLITCNLCYEFINEKDADSTSTFTCNHKICNQCIHRVLIYNQDNVFENILRFRYLTLICPLCKETEKGNLKTNKIELLSKISQSSEEICPKHEKSLKFLCEICIRKLCLSCFFKHLKTYPDHLITNINESSFCGIHESENFKYKCLECDLSACEICRDEKHSGHKIKYLKIFNKDKMAELKSGFPWKEENEIKEYIEKQFMPFKQSLEDGLKEVNKYCNNLIKMIQNIIAGYNEKYEQQVDDLETCQSLLINSYSKYCKELNYNANLNYFTLKVSDSMYFTEKEAIKQTLVDQLYKIEEEVKSIDNLIKTNTLSNIGIDYKRFNLNCVKVIPDNEHEPVYALAKLTSGGFASGSADFRIRIYNGPEYNCEKVLYGHTNFISSLYELSNGNLVSGSDDKNIIVWSLQNGYEIDKVLEGHTDSVRNIIQLQDSNFASGSWDKTIRIWDINDYRCIKIISEHTGAIRSLIFLSNGNVASGSWDKTIRIYNPSNGFECVKVLEGKTNFVVCLLELKDGRIVSGSVDSALRIWNPKGGEKFLELLNGHSETISTLLQLKDGRLVSGSCDKTIRIWDFSGEPSCIKVLEGHTDWLTSLIELDGGTIVSASCDGTIRIWK
jgi:WD40 repeat protein/ribosomal protein S17E